MVSENPFASIQGLSTGYFASRSLHVVAELGIADALGDEPITVEALATATNAEADALGRILRLLEPHGVFNLEGGSVTHLAASLLLRSHHPRSLRDFTRMFALTLNWRSAELLLDTVKTGDAAAPRAFNGGFCGGHLARNSEEASGQGHLIRAILRSCPEARGTLFDVEAARAAGDGGGRLTFHGGDFFKDQLPAADAYILMEVIHDWADPSAEKLLRTFKASAPTEAKLLLIETEVPEGPESDWSKTLDIRLESSRCTGNRRRRRNAGSHHPARSVR